MPRPPRLDPPGGWHHVFNRRPPGRLLVRSPLDRADFLALLAPLDARFGVEVHAYAVMDTHFHLLLRSRAGRPSRAAAGTARSAPPSRPATAAGSSRTRTTSPSSSPTST